MLAPITIIMPRDHAFIKDTKLGDVAGLLILREYLQEGQALSLSAEHDRIYLLDCPLPEAIPEHDLLLIDQLGWQWDAEHGWYCNV